MDGDSHTSDQTYDGNTKLQSFDGASRITQVVTGNGNTVDTTFDGDGRITSNGNGSFDFDDDGNLISASNANGTYNLSYNENDQMTQVTGPFGTTLSFGYDESGNQTLVTDSFGGTLASTYDADNYLIKRTYVGQGEQLRIDFTKNKEGWATTLVRYSDLAGTSLVATTEDGYNGAGQITNIQTDDATGTPIDAFSDDYDTSGNVTQQIEMQGGISTTIADTYDSSGQVTASGSDDYGYDLDGNRDTGGSTPGTGNQLFTDGAWDYTYDQDGNMTEKDTTGVGSSEKWTYAFNNIDQLDEVKHFDTSGTLVLTVDYKYDAFGQEIERDSTTGGTTTVTKFAQDGWNSNMAPPTGTENFNTWAVLNSGNTLQTRNIDGNGVDQHLARIDQTGASDPSGTYWTLTDPLGSVRDVIDNSGAVKDSLQYDAFGKITNETSGGTSYRGWYAWTGREFDTEIEMQYNRARWYDPSTGRWISQDPLGFDAGDSNLYRYANNCPTTALDPSGQDTVYLISHQASFSLNLGLLYFPHYAVKIERNNGTVTYYSYDGVWATNDPGDTNHPSTWWIKQTWQGLDGSYVDAALKMRRQRDNDTPYSIWTNNCFQNAVELLDDAAALSTKDGNNPRLAPGLNPDGTNQEGRVIRARP